MYLRMTMRRQYTYVSSRLDEILALAICCRVLREFKIPLTTPHRADIRARRTYNTCQYVAHRYSYTRVNVFHSHWLGAYFAARASTGICSINEIWQTVMGRVVKYCQDMR